MGHVRGQNPQTPRQFGIDIGQGPRFADLPIGAFKSAARMSKPGWTLFYLVLLPMVEMHVSVGFYRIGVKWGIISSGTRSMAKRAELILFAVFMTIGLLTIIRFLTLA